MADGKTLGSSTVQGNDLVDAAGNLGTSLVRLGTLMVSWPFYILPDKERDDAIAATTQLFTAVGDLHLSFVRAATRGLGLVAREITKSNGAEAPATTKAVSRVPIETTPVAAR